MEKTSDPRILVFSDRAEPFLPRLKTRFPELSFSLCDRGDRLLNSLAETQPEIVFAIKGPGTPGLAHRPLATWPSIRWIHVGGSGFEQIPAWNPEKRTVTNCAGLLARFLAENVTGAMIMLNFGFPAYLDKQRRGIWKPHGFSPLCGKTLLVVGLGEIGRWVARNARALGMKVIGLRRTARGSDPDVDELHPLSDLGRLLAQADFVSLHLRLTEQTWHLMNADMFKRMKPGAFLINTARGSIVEEKALIEALDSGAIAGAYLDVFEVEPLPPESPLWSKEQVVISPHSADMIDGWQCVFADAFGDNLEAWLQGKPLQKVVLPAGKD